MTGRYISCIFFQIFFVIKAMQLNSIKISKNVKMVLGVFVFVCYDVGKGHCFPVFNMYYIGHERWPP